jgi:hypothetical protein
MCDQPTFKQQKCQFMPLSEGKIVFAPSDNIVQGGMGTCEYGAVASDGLYVHAGLLGYSRYTSHSLHCACISQSTGPPTHPPHHPTPTNPKVAFHREATDGLVSTFADVLLAATVLLPPLHALGLEGTGGRCAHVVWKGQAGGVHTW